jgi:hypothetical protein
MTPWQLAHSTAMSTGVTPEEWDRRLGRCLASGWVISTPTEFLAFHEAEYHEQPAYFVLMAAGGGGNVLARFMRYAPEPKPWVLWCRNNESRIRAFHWEQLSKKAGI